MISRRRELMLLRALNNLMFRYGGSQLPWKINGHRDQWLIGGHYANNHTMLSLMFCQGRHVGRILRDRGFTVTVPLDKVHNDSSLIDAVAALDPRIEREQRERDPKYQAIRRRAKLHNRRLGTVKSTIARRYRTGKSIPKKLLDRLERLAGEELTLAFLRSTVSESFIERFLQQRKQQPTPT